MSDSNAPTWPETLARASASLVPSAVGGDAVRIVVDDVIARRLAKSDEFVGAVTDGLDEQELRRRMSIDRVGTVVGNAGDAAVTSAHEGKRRALARVARNAIKDDAKLDESEMVVQVLTQLESPHIAALARLGEVAERMAVKVTQDPELRLYAEQQDKLNKAIQAVADRENFSVLSVLHSLGLLLPPPAIIGGSNAQWVGGLSDLGRSLLSYLSLGDQA